MNKQERKLKGIYKFKKRIANYRVTGTNANLLRKQGKPCSCVMCSPAKTGETKASVQRKEDKFNFILRCDTEVRNAQVAGYAYLFP